MTPDDAASTPAQTAQAGRNWLARLVLSVVAIDLAVIVLGTMAMGSSRTIHRERADVATQNVSRLLESNLRSTFDRIDLSLKLLAHRMASMDMGRADAAKAELLVSMASQSDVASFQVFDARGDLVAATHAMAGQRLNVSGDDLFNRLRSEPAIGLAVSRARRSAIDGAWSIVFGRRLQRPDGSFGGVAAATLKLQYFSGLFGGIDLGPKGAITLRDQDQALIVRKPALPEPDIGKRRVSPDAERAIAANPERGTFTANTGSDGIERSVSYARVAGYPFYVIAGSATEDYLADWRAEARKAASLVAAFIAATAVLSWLLARAWKRREMDLAAALEQTRAGMERFRNLFHASPIPTVIASVADGRIRDANDAYCQRHEIDRNDLLGRSMDEFTFGIAERDRCEMHRRLKTDGRVQDLVVRVRMPSGQDRTAVVNCETISYRDEQCALAMSLDVTDRQQAEQAQHEMAIAVAANRAKTEFLSRISHELRTPLNAVLGFSELLECDPEGRLDEQQLAHVDHIQRAGRHLLGLITDLLDVSLIEAGQLQVQMTPLDLAALVDEALRLSGPLAAHHGVVTSAHACDGWETWVLGDAVRLRQVLLNLLSNAIKYNHRGGTVRVELCDAGDGVHLDVIDTGMGMSGEQLDHLYEPFNRLGREHGTIDGKGIGLALTHQLVHLMGGELHAQSEVEAGTRMRVTLRRALAQSCDAERRPEPVRAIEPLASGCVLYIEDNPVNVLLVESFLSRLPGVRLEIAENGAAGIRIARALRPDLVLLDMNLPDMAGIDVLQALRGDEATHRLRVIALSASAMPDDIVRARRHGASDYWTKPLALAHFLNDIGRLLERAGPHPSPLPQAGEGASGRANNRPLEQPLDNFQTG